MQIDKIIEISMLFDFYGQLLSEKQREIYSLYHEDNLSLGEISSEVGISRQGVHDALKKAEKLLSQYEEKLGLIKKFSKTQQAIDDLDRKIEALTLENMMSSEMTVKLRELKNIIDELND